MNPPWAVTAELPMRGCGSVAIPVPEVSIIHESRDHVLLPNVSRQSTQVKVSRVFNLSVAIFVLQT